MRLVMRDGQLIERHVNDDGSTRCERVVLVKPIGGTFAVEAALVSHYEAKGCALASFDQAQEAFVTGHVKDPSIGDDEQTRAAARDLFAAMVDP